MGKICVSEFVLIVLADLLPLPFQLFSGHVSIVLVRWLIPTLYEKGTFGLYKKSGLSEKRAIILRFEISCGRAEKARP